MKKEIERLTSLLRETNPLSEDYGKLIGYIERLRWMSQTPQITEAPVAVKENPEPVVAEEIKVEEPEIKEEPVIKDEVIIEKAPVVEDKKTPTYEEVRAIFKDAAASGVIIRPIIEKFTPDGVTPNLSAIPTNKYAELLEELNNAR